MAWGVFRLCGMYRSSCGGLECELTVRHRNVEGVLTMEDSSLEERMRNRFVLGVKSGG